MDAVLYNQSTEKKSRSSSLVRAGVERLSDLEGEKSAQQFFYTTTQEIDRKYKVLESEVKPLVEEVNQIASEVVGFKSMTRKLAQSAAGIDTGKADNKEKKLRDLIEQLKISIPIISRKVAMFERESEVSLSRVDTSFASTSNLVALYSTDLKKRINYLKSLLGPLNSRLITISTMYFRTLDRLNNIKKAIAVANKGKLVATAVTTTPAWVPIAIIVGIIVLIISAIIIFALVKATDSPGATIETIINTQCADSTDTNCMYNFIQYSVDKQFDNRN